MVLCSNLKTDWEALGRMLNVHKPDIDAIKTHNVHMVEEQALQMFEQWVKKNGLGATVGVLATAVYNSGSQYWNLLDIIYAYTSEQYSYS